MMLPTCDPDYLDPDFFDDWLETIQGPIITAAADDDDDHRAFLLRVVLTYRAFAQRNPALNMDDYVVFTGMFVQAALALQVNDDAATDLQAIDDWMTETIPLVSTISPRYSSALSRSLFRRYLSRATSRLVRRSSSELPPSHGESLVTPLSLPTTGPPPTSTR